MYWSLRYNPNPASRVYDHGFDRDVNTILSIVFVLDDTKLVVDWITRFCILGGMTERNNTNKVVVSQSKSPDNERNTNERRCTMKVTLKMIEQADKEAGGANIVVMLSVRKFVFDETNSIADRAAALRLICKYMPRKQGDMTDAQFVNSFLNGEPF